MKKKLILFACAGTLLVLSAPLHFLFGSAATQEPTARAKASRAKKPPTPATPSTPAVIMPFRVGETLNYRVGWASFTSAAALQVSIPEKRNLFGWPTWHFRAALHTESPVRTLFAVDDEFDSYADASVLDTRRYESYQSELGRKEDRVLHFIAVGQKPWGPGPDVVVLPGTHDPVDALYALREVDWQRTPEFRVPVYDGHDIYQLSAKLDAKSETVSVAAGTFSTSRVGVKLSQNDKKAPEITFEVWLANNPARTPVQFQAQLPFGSIRAELVPSTN